MAITKILYHPIFIIFVTIIAIIFFFSLEKSSKKTQSSAGNIKILEQEVKIASEKLLVIDEKIAQTQSEQFIEKIVRNELLVQKPGEYVLQIPDKHEQVDTDCYTQPCTNTETVQEQPLQAWLDLLF